jgi:hypothetical protein
MRYSIVDNPKECRILIEGGNKNMKWIRLLCLSSLVLSLLMNTGCPPAVMVGGGAAAGSASFAYISGELKSTEQVSLNLAWQATQTAMDDLGFHITSRVKDAFDAELTASGARDKKIRIVLKKISDTCTEVKIRVGTFGSQSLSAQILEAIRRRF